MNTTWRATTSYWLTDSMLAVVIFWHFYNLMIARAPLEKPAACLIFPLKVRLPFLRLLSNSQHLCASAVLLGGLVFSAFRCLGWGTSSVFSLWWCVEFLPVSLKILPLTYFSLSPFRTSATHVLDLSFVSQISYNCPIFSSFFLCTSPSNFVFTCQYQ